MARECAAILLDQRGNLEVYKFAEKMGEKLDSFVSDSNHGRSKQQENVWTAFYTFRASELGVWWLGFMNDVKLPGKFHDPWFIQTVARVALEKIIEVKHPLRVPSISEVTNLSIDEHNTLRYCAGYVLRSLKRKYPSLQTWFEKQTDNSGSSGTDSFTQFVKMDQWNWISLSSCSTRITVSFSTFCCVGMALKYCRSTSSIAWKTS